VLVNKCRIYEEDSRARSDYYKSSSEKKGKNQDRGKPYEVPDDRGKQKFQHEAVGGEETSGGDTPAPLRCFTCGGVGHCAAECNITGLKCFNYGEQGQLATECKNIVSCYNCGELGHINTQCQKPKKAQFGGKVFALSGEDVLGSDN